MPAWLVYLLLIELIIVVTNTNEADYAWMQALRRPRWLAFHVWSPLIRLACYAGFYGSLLLVHGRNNSPHWIIIYLSLLSLSELAVWVTCRMRRLGLGSGIGITTSVAVLLLAVAVHRIDPAASLALMPFLIWLVIENLGQAQMLALNGQVFRRQGPRRSPAAHLLAPSDPARLVHPQHRRGGR